MLEGNKFIMQTNNQTAILEITVLSAQNLMGIASLAFSRRLRPFITLTADCRAAGSSSKHVKMYKTRVDDKGGVNPTWGDKFQLSLDHNFFYQRCSGIYLQLYTKHLLMGQTQLGWCLIPAADIVNRFSIVGPTQFLSYRLRAKDGSRGHGIVNVAVRLQGSLGIVHPPRSLISNAPHLPEVHENDQLVIGIPVKSSNLCSQRH
ncbi:uncharacterized protein LOC110012455 [Sesamum indicum]|uniref:Uncharacterized protein LOC110012455 n=1 Tax=Sesamum indicum TaxID=4182 RepID=A0A8M8V633_SESIN|nr:uncharacterized protein LOC110012455 [Sesamum indicum]